MERTQQESNVATIVMDHWNFQIPSAALQCGLTTQQKQHYHPSLFFFTSCNATRHTTHNANRNDTCNATHNARSNSIQFIVVDQTTFCLSLQLFGKFFVCENKSYAIKKVCHYASAVIYFISTHSFHFIVSFLASSLNSFGWLFSQQYVSWMSRIGCSCTPSSTDAIKTNIFQLNHA